MSWTTNKVLLEYNENTSCKAIFQAVCDEIGKHYKNLNYSSSKTKLTIEDEKIKLEICFWSSRNNQPGKWVNLEIIPSFYAKQLKNKSLTKGFLIGHTALFYHKYKNDKTKVMVNQIYGDVIELTDEYGKESLMKDNHNCNVYGIDKEKFNKIIAFIDLKILPWFNKIKETDGILELLHNARIKKVVCFNGKGEDSDFTKYVKMNFSNIDIQKEMNLNLKDN